MVLKKSFFLLPSSNAPVLRYLTVLRSSTIEDAHTQDRRVCALFRALRKLVPGTTKETIGDAL
jgi:hypothetical protein